VARHYGVTNGKQKLIRYYGPSHLAGEEYDTWELFDLEKDPNEMQSVYGDSAYAEVQKTLHAKLDALREQYQVGEDTYVAPARKKRDAKAGKGNAKKVKAKN
jgi:hypothetical protein